MAIGEVYTLRRDVFLCRSNHPLDPIRDWLLPAGSGERVDHPMPQIEEYRRTRRPAEVEGVIPAGTRLSLTKILFQDSVTWAKVYYIFTIRDGPTARRKVCANALMKGATHTEPGVPDDEYLERAQ